MTKDKDYSHLTEDENVQNRFTAYVATAIRHQRNNYLIKLSQERKMVLSLDEMMEGNKIDPAFTIQFEDTEKLFDSDTTLENIICNDTLLIGILKLSDRERRILNLRLIQKMKHAEIADLLGLKAKTVEKTYERLIKKLRIHMRGGKDEEF